MVELDRRKGTILRAVVVEYVTGAEPVGSSLLTSKYPLGVKGATVRNELAELTEMGFIEQPHTSAGRVPSDLGYRYFVDNLILLSEPETSERDQLREVTDDGEALQTMLHGAIRALSRVTHLLTAAAVLREANVVVRHAVVSAMGPQQALLVLVLGNGHMENRLVECPPGLTLDDIGVANEALGKALAGKPLRSILKSRAPTVGGPTPQRFVTTLWSLLRSIARERSRGTLATEGEEFLLAQPEFQRDAPSLALLLDQLKNSDILFETLSDADHPQGVTIGREHRHEQLHRLSVVRQTVYVGDTEAGTIAIVGPTRMRYESSIPLVNYTAQALSESLTKFLGKP